MFLPGRRLWSALALGLTAVLGTGALAPPARAASQFETPKYAAIVVDANTGEVLYQRRADAQRFPASITKIMTLYLTFEALETGRLHLTDRVPFSSWARGQAPSKLGVQPGETISVNEAIEAIAVKSANDVAVAMAERIGGTEAHFAQLMTLRAQELGMTGTRYVNANGLPDSRQITTARDIAILSRAVMRDYPQDYHYFNTRAITWHGQTTQNHNHLMNRMPGMDGLKTGYTNAAGFNLAASAVRGGRRLIAVVLGGSSTAARDNNVEDLMDAGFDVMSRRAHGQPNITLASVLDAPTDDAAGPVIRTPTEMGSGRQPELRLIPNATVPTRVAAIRSERSGAQAQPEAASVVPAAPDCRRLRGHSLRRCRVEARRVAHRARAVRQEVAAAPAADCSHRHGRRARHACARERASLVAAVAPAAPDCAGKHGRRLHACHAANNADASARVTTAAAAPDCAGKHGRRERACRAEAHKAAKAALRTASASPADCAGLRGRRLRACHREDASAKLETKATRRHAAVAEAKGKSHHGRRAATEAKAEAKGRHAKAAKLAQHVACRHGRHCKSAADA